MTHPLSRLFEHGRRYRREVTIATLFSILNKIFDVLPEVLIGMAVDVVVSQKAAVLGRAGGWGVVTLHFFTATPTRPPRRHCRAMRPVRPC